MVNEVQQEESIPTRVSLEKKTSPDWWRRTYDVRTSHGTLSSIRRFSVLRDVTSKASLASESITRDKTSTTTNFPSVEDKQVILEPKPKRIRMRNSTKGKSINSVAARKQGRPVINSKARQQTSALNDSEQLLDIIHREHSRTFPSENSQNSDTVQTTTGSSKINSMKDFLTSLVKVKGSKNQIASKTKLQTNNRTNQFIEPEDFLISTTNASVERKETQLLHLTDEGSGVNENLDSVLRNELGFEMNVNVKNTTSKATLPAVSTTGNIVEKNIDGLPERMLSVKPTLTSQTDVNDLVLSQQSLEADSVTLPNISVPAFHLQRNVTEMVNTVTEQLNISSVIQDVSFEMENPIDYKSSTEQTRSNDDIHIRPITTNTDSQAVPKNGTGTTGPNQSFKTTTNIKKKVSKLKTSVSLSNSFEIPSTGFEYNLINSTEYLEKVTPVYNSSKLDPYYSQAPPNNKSSVNPPFSRQHLLTLKNQTKSQQNRGKINQISLTFNITNNFSSIGVTPQSNITYEPAVSEVANNTSIKHPQLKPQMTSDKNNVHNVLTPIKATTLSFITGIDTNTQKTKISNPVLSTLLTSTTITRKKDKIHLSPSEELQPENSATNNEEVFTYSQLYPSTLHIPKPTTQTEFRTLKISTHTRTIEHTGNKEYFHGTSTFSTPRRVSSDNSDTIPAITSESKTVPSNVNEARSTLNPKVNTKFHERFPFTPSSVRQVFTTISPKSTTSSSFLKITLPKWIIISRNFEDFLRLSNRMTPKQKSNINLSSSCPLHLQKQ
ncbi:uncharacterized protein LOC118762687 [Octopus sinensis]|uniref:Uncharacterized protein LOC118762687 n=1 Tax=Octopus sinensis TaxID=2607531 RepID=A0A7E6ERH7_9MOLL|nr:uncharacterized protein LOC118762687 [Octopus sinensis]